MADLTTGDLLKSKTITDDEVNAAVDVFMKDPTSLFQFANGRSLGPRRCGRGASAGEGGRRRS